MVTRVGEADASGAVTQELVEQLRQADNGNARGRVGDGIREEKTLSVDEGAAGVDDVRHVSARALLRRGYERLLEPAQDAKRIFSSRSMAPML